MCQNKELLELYMQASVPVIEWEAKLKNYKDYGGNYHPHFISMDKERNPTVSLTEILVLVINLLRMNKVCVQLVLCNDGALTKDRKSHRQHLESSRFLKNSIEDGLAPLAIDHEKFTATIMLSPDSEKIVVTIKTEYRLPNQTNIN